MDSLFFKAIRWVLVLPAAIAAYFIGYKIFMWANNEFAGLYFLANLMSIIGCGFSAACFVALGSLTAPFYRKVTSIVLATIGSMIGVSMIVLVFMSEESGWLMIFQNVANIAGFVLGAVYISEEYSEDCP